MALLTVCRLQLMAINVHSYQLGLHTWTGCASYVATQTPQCHIYCFCLFLLFIIFSFSSLNLSLHYIYKSSKCTYFQNIIVLYWFQTIVIHTYVIGSMKTPHTILVHFHKFKVENKQMTIYNLHNCLQPSNFQKLILHTNMILLAVIYTFFNHSRLHM